MAKKAQAPEISVSEGPIFDLAKEVVAIHTEVTDLQAKEAEKKTSIANEAEALRVAETGKGNFISLVRITGEDLPAIRVEFRMANGALAVDQGPLLDELFGPSRTLLFGKEKRVTEILDPQALIEGLQAQGRNPWDFLTLTVKDESHGIVAEAAPEGSVVAQEAYLPRKGMIGTLNEISHTLTEPAIRFIKEYLGKALKVVPVIGSRGAKA